MSLLSHIATFPVRLLRSRPIAVVVREPMEGNVETEEFDKALALHVGEALQRAAWHGDSRWIDGYVDTFTMAVLRTLDAHYELREKP